MSYEIPQQLEYQEKIIFGLTFRQLLYAMIFLPVALALLFKTPLEFPYRVTLALVPSGLAILFMFTNIPKATKNWIKWLLSRSLDENQIKQFLSLKEIKEDTLILNRGKLSILKVEPINFTLRNQQEKDMINF